jgi:arylformamidase
MVGNTGTYLDSPYHRYADGADLAGLALGRLADLPAVVVRTAGTGLRAVDVGALAAHEVAGRAVLLHTGGDVSWGAPDYPRQALPDRGRAPVAGRPRCPARRHRRSQHRRHRARRPGGTGRAAGAQTLLLAADIPVVEHLTGLAQLPPHGARFTPVPPRVAGFSTFPVRAYAAVPGRQA